MPGLSEGQLASQARQHDRLRVGVGRAFSSAVRTGGWLRNVLVATPGKLVLGQQARDFIANFAGQLFQVDQRSRRRQFPLMFTRQLCHQGFHSLLKPALHSPILLDPRSSS